MTNCKDRCWYIEGSIPGPMISLGKSTISPYLLGYKGCSSCTRFFKTQKMICECCGKKLRIPDYKFRKMMQQSPGLVQQLEGNIIYNMTIGKKISELEKHLLMLREEKRQLYEKILETRNELEVDVRREETKAIMKEVVATAKEEAKNSIETTILPE